MCFGDGPLGFDRASRTKRWGVATDAELAAALREPGLAWLDVRSDAEARAAPLPAALRVRRCPCTMFSTAELARRAPALLPDKAAPILVFCAASATRARSRTAAAPTTSPRSCPTRSPRPPSSPPRRAAPPPRGVAPLDFESGIRSRVDIY